MKSNNEHGLKVGDACGVRSDQFGGARAAKVTGVGAGGRVDVDVTLDTAKDARAMKRGGLTAPIGGDGKPAETATLALVGLAVVDDGGDPASVWFGDEHRCGPFGRAVVVKAAV